MECPVKTQTFALSLVISAFFSLTAFAADITKTVSFPKGATEAQILAKGVEVARDWIKTNPTVKAQFQKRLQTIRDHYEPYTLGQKALQGIVIENQTSHGQQEIARSGAILVMSPITANCIGSGCFTGQMTNILLNVSFHANASLGDETFKKFTYTFGGFSNIVAE